MTRQTVTERKMAKARVQIVLKQPFFAHLLLRLNVVHQESVGTMGVDGTTLFYSDEFCKDLSDAELMCVVLHEVLHCAYLHHARRGSRDEHLWNVAADLAINSIISNQKLGKLPSSALLPDKYKLPDDKHAEWYYDNAPKQMKQDAKAGVYLVTGKVADAQQPQQQEAEWRVAVQRAAAAAAAIGKLPQAFEGFVEQQEAKLDWRTLLQRFVQETLRADYRWNRPSTRYLHAGLYLPSLRGDGLPPIVVATDCSGSVSEDMFSRFMSELSSVISMCNPENVVAIQCDSAIQREDEVDDVADVDWKRSGRGGTRVQPVFDRVEARGDDPACLIYFTDGEVGDYPAEPVGYPVLWCIADRGYAAQPPWGEVVAVE